MGTYSLRAWVIRDGTNVPNAWKYSEPITVHFVKVASVSESATEVCINQEVTFTANPENDLHCVEWERRYREDEDANWTDWAWVAAGDTAELDSNTSNTPGEYQYRAFNGDSNSCATDVNSEIVTVVEVGDVNFSCASVCVGGTCTASADIAPSGRDIKWTIPEPKLGCDIDAKSGVITAGTTAGTITVKGADANVPSCSDTNQLDVVDVLSIEIKYDDANWADVTEANIVVLKGTKYLFRVWPDPEGASWPSPPQWSGAASGVGIFKLVTFNTEGTHDVTVKCCSTCGDGKTVNIEVVEPNVYQVGFDGDHSLYETPGNPNEPNDPNHWYDGDTAIVDPVYDCNTGDNNEVCVTKNSNSVSLYKVRLRVDEAVTYATTIRVDGSGTEDWDESADVNFPGASTTSDEASLDITGNVINEVKKYDDNFQIQWKYKVPSGTNTYYTINTTNHTLYVTWGTPNPSGDDVTVKRIDWVVDAADGSNAIVPAANSVFNSLSGSFDLGADMWGPVPIWLLHNAGEESQCPGLARFVSRHFRMLGLTSTEVIKYCHAKPDGTYAASDSSLSQSRTLPFAGHSDPTTHDDYDPNEALIHWDGDTPPGSNNYEATCFFSGNHYALGVGIFSTAKACVKAAFTSISWEYVALDSPGPPPTYKWQTCNEDPWTEAP